MQVSHQWRTAGLLAGALLIGTVIGPPLAQAASSALVRIEGGHSTNVAAVSKSGRLSVNAGLTMTPAGQVKTAPASPADTVITVGQITTCPNGHFFYKIPAGKALIITSVTFATSAQTPGTPHSLALAAGKPSAPCGFGLAFSEAPSSMDAVAQNQVFSPGIAVPAGDGLVLEAGQDNGEAWVYGYLVPAAAVPASALKNARAGAPRGLAAVTPPR
jgi:hypothetical protein